MENNLSNSMPESVTREKLVEDLRILVRDAEDLVKVTAGTVAERSREELKVALERLKSSSQRIEAKAASSIEATDLMIREYPYQSLGVAFGLGLLVGVLVNR